MTGVSVAMQFLKIHKNKNKSACELLRRARQGLSRGCRGGSPGELRAHLPGKKGELRRRAAGSGSIPEGAALAASLQLNVLGLWKNAQQTLEIHVSVPSVVLAAPQ